MTVLLPFLRSEGHLANRNWFSIVVSVVILFNALCMGVEADVLRATSGTPEGHAGTYPDPPTASLFFSRGPIQGPGAVLLLCLPAGDVDPAAQPALDLL